MEINWILTWKMGCVVRSFPFFDRILISNVQNVLFSDHMPDATSMLKCSPLQKPRASDKKEKSNYKCDIYEKSSVNKGKM